MRDTKTLCYCGVFLVQIKTILLQENPKVNSVAYDKGKALFMRNRFFVKLKIKQTHFILLIINYDNMLHNENIKRKSDHFHLKK